MSETTAFFSIVVPTYNRAHLIGKTIQSILTQDFGDFEVLVIDDGSKDNTAEVMSGFSDSRIQYIRKENAERGAARNYGAINAKGQYVNFFDSDDLMYPNHLRVARELIEKRNSPEFFHLAYDHRLHDGTLLGRADNFDGHTKQLVLFNNKLSCNGVFLRKDIAHAYPFEENRVLASSEDWTLWIKLLCRFELQISNEITSSVVNHDQRSLITIAAEKVEARDLLMIRVLQQDAEVMRAYGSSFKKFIAERYTFFMLCFSEQMNSKKVWEWAAAAVRVYPAVAVSRRFLASIKNSIFK